MLQACVEVHRAMAGNLALVGNTQAWKQFGAALRQQYVDLREQLQLTAEYVRRVGAIRAAVRGGASRFNGGCTLFPKTKATLWAALDVYCSAFLTVLSVHAAFAAGRSLTDKERVHCALRHRQLPFFARTAEEDDSSASSDSAGLFAAALVAASALQDLSF